MARNGAGGVPVNLSGVKKVYSIAAGPVVALDGLDWYVGPGDAVAIMGPSGCGKTTLLNLLGAIDRATEGSVVVGDTDLSRLSERQLEAYRLRQVGYVFQFYNLVPSLTALENVELPMLIAGVPGEARRARAKELLDAVGLGEKGHKRPEELSGGEQQRVAICLALANDPPLILADEPTGNLDSTNAALITRLLLSLSQERGKTVIVATHDPQVASVFPRVDRMRDGRIVRD
jgi:putative ABC transport system ATP-binding protein